ncbi:MAG: hypothetical protein RUDDFDWM_000159 [Candidatus Fervidibacterota bacterium]
MFHEEKMDNEEKLFEEDAFYSPPYDISDEESADIDADTDAYLEEERTENTEAEDAMESFMQFVANTPTLTEEEETELLKRLRSGDLEARHRIAEANLRLVIHVAKQFANQTALPFPDIVQEGSIGLLKAIDKFDWRKGCRFSTYATWWIRHSIRKAIAEQSGSIKLPLHIANTISKVVRATSKLMQKLGRKPTLEEIAKEVKIPLRKLEEIMPLMSQMLSLESKFSSDDIIMLVELLKDETTPTPEEAWQGLMVKERLRELLSLLTERERDVLSLRYGLVDGKERTLLEVGSILKISGERVRQIEQQALRKIRNLASTKYIHDFI